MFGELNGGDSMMETLGLQFKDKIYDDMKTDEHTDERMEALREQELRTKPKRKGLFSIFRRNKKQAENLSLNFNTLKLNNADTTKEMVVPKGAEGWGRLNLFEASNGYGAFATDVTVDMDADNGFDLLKSTSLTSQFDEIVVNAPQDFDGSIVYTDNGEDC